jgi:serine/threonine protein kinase
LNPAEQVAMTSRQIGNYRILEYVGGGGFGSVFKAEDVNSPGRFVAIKELHKRHTRSAVMKQRFFQEALAMARLDHPNLPRLYTFGEDNGCYYLVMEFVSGCPLSEEIERTGPMPQKRSVAVITQVLEGVSYAHKNGVIHRDLKPDNIILTGDNDSLVVKVLDFGIAKMFGGENLTMTGEGFGTPRYMSPERIAGASELDRRTDIYSIGIILFEILTGRVPFASNSTNPLFYWTEMRKLHENEPLPGLSSFGVSPALEQVVKKAAAKHLEDRYSTADEMLAALRGESMTASLLLSTAPVATEVYVDDIFRGLSDEARGNISIEGLAAGLHSVRVSKTGFGTYQIDVSLASGRPTELQVQLSANATVAIPKYEEQTAGTIDYGTDKIESGDDVKTVIITLDNLPAGGTLALGSSAPLPVDQDGRATLALTPGVHELQITDQGGQSRKQTVTVGNPVSGTGQGTAVVAPPSPPPPPPPASPGGVVAPAPQPRGGGPIQQTRTLAQPVSPPATDKHSVAKWVTIGVSLFLIVGLLVAAYIVISGPGRSAARFGSAAQTAPSPTPTQADSGQGPVQVLAASNPSPEPSPQASSVPSLEPSPSPSPIPSPSPTRSVADAKNSPKPEPSKPDEIVDDQAKPERKTKQGSELATVLPTPTPTARPTPSPRPTPPAAKPSPTKTDQDLRHTEGVGNDACLVVAVTGPGGRGMARFAITCSELTGTGHPNSYGGRTGPLGRWRQCGMTPGHRVIVQVFDQLGNALAGRQSILGAGQNTIEVRIN